MHPIVSIENEIQLSDCCSPKEAMGPAMKRKCPVDGKSNSAVPLMTILHHIKDPWNWNHAEQNYYFCSDPECDVVYFGEDGSTVKKCDLRTPVGIKEKSGSAIICYCFGVTRDEAGRSTQAMEFVVEKTKEHACACKTRNPSGKCCLKDFPK
jgi:hypothetical protein